MVRGGSCGCVTVMILEKTLHPTFIKHSTLEYVIWVLISSSDYPININKPIAFLDTIIQRRRAKMGVSKSTDKTEKFSLKGDLKKKPTQSREIKENCFMLKPGIIPSGRQIFYQVLKHHFFSL